MNGLTREEFLKWLDNEIKKREPTGRDTYSDGVHDGLIDVRIKVKTLIVFQR